MQNRKITLIFNNQKFKVLDILIRISQNSLLFSILFLFYNAELLKICNSIRVRVSSLEFVNDMNLLAYGRITEDNCRQLKLIHDRCLAWAKRYGALFTLEKYALMHFSRRRRFNMQAL